MLDFFVIFSKGGIIVFNTEVNIYNDIINKFIRLSILENKNDQFNHDSLAIKYLLDNEYNLIFLVGYQKILKLNYIDKFLKDILLAFHYKYKNFNINNKFMFEIDINDFKNEYQNIYTNNYKKFQNQPQNKMRSYFESEKSKKTVSSIIIQKNGEKFNDKSFQLVSKKNIIDQEKKQILPIAKKIISNKSPKTKTKKTDEKAKKTKENRNWGFVSNTDSTNLDFSKKESNQIENKTILKNVENIKIEDLRPNLEFDQSSSDDEDDFDKINQSQNKNKKKSLFGNFIKNFSYNKALEQDDLKDVLNQLRDYMISKNVASEIAVKLTKNVGISLIGQKVNTWLGLKSFVKKALEESILRILSPNRNINILSDIRSKKTLPYVIVFCGVNGVGKSTNLAKISNWLITNNIKVLVVACDTFRAGAIEQLKTHVTALKALHEKDGYICVELFEKGYGKDSAAIAMDAISFAKQVGYNCCLIDTAGRMQDNEPLMRQLAKLIKINQPDLTLFVGEALVGNEAVDQLTKFNNSLIDYGCKGITENSSAINGIVLTKFDTIDDQVGAAVSMTYITGQPIIFVGVGQTYKDLKQLDAKSVVKALMR